MKNVLILLRSSVIPHFSDKGCDKISTLGSGGLMARKDIRMEELVEVLYQWHKGRNISQIKRALELDRKSG